MRTIKEWQVEAHRLATEKGFHSRECPEWLPESKRFVTLTHGRKEVGA